MVVKYNIFQITTFDLFGPVAFESETFGHFKTNDVSPSWLGKKEPDFRLHFSDRRKKTYISNTTIFHLFDAVSFEDATLGHHAVPKLLSPPAA